MGDFNERPQKRPYAFRVIRPAFDLLPKRSVDGSDRSSEYPAALVDAGRRENQ